jgi:hypothetical protein
MTQGRATDSSPASPGAGLILQRGGEELLLEKARDRLTTRLADNAAL